MYLKSWHKSWHVSEVVACIAPVSLSDGLIRGGHGQYSNGWGRRVTQFSCLGFLGSILQSSFEGAGRAKCKAGLSKMRLDLLHHSVAVSVRGAFGCPQNPCLHATENGFHVKLAFPSRPCVRAHLRTIVRQGRIRHPPEHEDKESATYTYIRLLGASFEVTAWCLLDHASPIRYLPSRLLLGAMSRRIGLLE
jgi:hypothetical protein